MIAMKYLFKRKKLIAWLLVAIWMGVIFYLSHQSGVNSSKLSSGLLKFIIQIFTILFPSNLNVESLHFLIRKGAHLFAYLLLGLLVINALYEKNNKTVEFLVALSICVIYAITDEVHQLFVPGRSGEITDVII